MAPNSRWQRLVRFLGHGTSTPTRSRFYRPTVELLESRDVPSGAAPSVASVSGLSVLHGHQLTGIGGWSEQGCGENVQGRRTPSNFRRPGAPPKANSARTPRPPSSTSTSTPGCPTTRSSGPSKRCSASSSVAAPGAQVVRRSAPGAAVYATIQERLWAPYDHFVSAAHQQCQTHVLRRAHALKEAAVSRAKRFPRQVITLLQESLAKRDAFAAQTPTPAQRQSAHEDFPQRLLALTAASRRDAEQERFAKHLDAYAEQ